MAHLILPITNGLLSRNFESSEYYLIYNSQMKNMLVRLDPLKMETDPMIKFPWLGSYPVTDIIAHDMHSENLVSFFDLKINVFVGVALATPEQLIEEFERGVLKSNFNSIKGS